jgi:hypothetical protein
MRIRFLLCATAMVTLAATAVAVPALASGKDNTGRQDVAGVSAAAPRSARASRIHDYALQSSTSGWITTHLASLAAQGIVAGYWGPGKSGDDVLLALKGAAASQYAELQRTARRLVQAHQAAGIDLPATIAVNAANYMRVASAVLNSEAPGPVISLMPAFTGPITSASGPRADKKPFHAADQIWYTLGNSDYCTSNVEVRVKRTGKYGVLTAAHCSHYDKGRGFYTCATHDSSGECDYGFGKVTALDSSLNDWEYIPTSSMGRAWDDSNSSVWPVVGWRYTEGGDRVTTDAIADGVKHNLLVQSAGASNSCFSESGDGMNNHAVCDAVILSARSRICVAGDSGGLITIVDGHGNATVVGIIDARSGPSNGTYNCYGQQIGYILNINGLSLVTVPARR